MLDDFTKITELKKSDDFETIYKFLDELSSKGNLGAISKPCEEGLWKSIAPKKYQFDMEKNVLHVASENGNLRLVKSLIECGCDKETKIQSGWTPLLFASKNGLLNILFQLELIKKHKIIKDLLH
ncbi:hypothetical protein TVAG_202870 [Trichomonas vaginalis G3]|uniref:Uncharacterized protein n=1 Tax=Trichomonas vaginalis (strain ATCC PRA-98 / G3) TaxID=412133 RepID=A2ENF9_TRIV3|nr:spectrin binding [Trichomonas vaginalis G3]EAY05829.1 hypothetical protein TVAG_202870 [Trichomonas vaginalis G3]KAI5516380.1 spectrin binding [Trichomonas vaginalis G3]|eukprot:XP_001318052.1 hypothetical protein [Trichomonas vaginalis G3]